MSDERRENFPSFSTLTRNNEWKLSACVLVTLRENNRRATASNVILFQRLKALCGLEMLFWNTVYIMLHDDLMNVVEWICMEFP